MACPATLGTVVGVLGCVTVQSGDRDEAFCAFVEARSPALLRTAFLLAGSHALAEDLLQETLLKVYLAWPRIRDRGAVEDYTRTVLVRTFVSFLRRRDRREVVLPDPVPDRVGAPGPQGGSDAGVGERDEMWTALSRLGPRQRAVLVLRFYEDLSEAQISEVLNCSTGTVKSQAARGLARLAQILELRGHG